MKQNTKLEVYQQFLERLVGDSKELDVDIADALNQHFWELYEKYSN